MTILRNQLQNIHQRVRRHFRQRADNGERWDMPPAGYDGNQLLTDDCDGFCLACRILLRRRGIASRLVYCEIGGNGHLVVEVQGWILDLKQPRVVANRQLSHYRWLRISGFDAGEPWRTVLPE